MQTQNKVYVILGLTGTGKSKTVAQLDKARYEVVSCDSRQFYKGLEITTAAPTQAQQEKITHHLVSFLTPNKKFSAGRYIRLAKRKIREIIHIRKKTPILVGGSGFYYRALKSGMFPLKTPVEIQQQVAMLTPAQRLQRLYEIDANALCDVNKAAIEGRIHPNDDYRISRALEVNLTSGKNWLQIWQEARQNHNSEFDFHGVWLGLYRGQ